MEHYERLHIEASEAKAKYLEAYNAYLKAEPGRDLTIKQGHMFECRKVYTSAVHKFFNEYEKTHDLPEKSG